MSDRDDDLLLVNPLPWSRTVSGPVSPNVVNPRGGSGDPFSARHYQDSGRPDYDYVLPPTTVPGYGHVTVPTDRLRQPERNYDSRATIETERYRITFDRETGGIAAWWDKELECEWVDGTADVPFGAPVSERAGGADAELDHGLIYRTPEAVDGAEDVNGVIWHAAPELSERRLDPAVAENLGWQGDWHAVRRGPAQVRRHRVYDIGTAYLVEQTVSVPGLGDEVELRFVVSRERAGVTVEAEWEASPDDDVESTYISFPFAMDDPTPRIDVGGQAMQPGRDQLTGTNRDYFPVQRWVDFSEADRGVTIGCPLNPLVQLGDFTYGSGSDEFEFESPLFLGWVSATPIRTENVRARYHIRPSGGAFDESRAHRVGLEAEHDQPLAQTMGEPPADDRSLPAEGSLLDLPEPPVLVESFQPAQSVPSVFRPGRPTDPADDDRSLLVLLNASDQEHDAVVGSGQLSIDGVSRTDLYGVDDETGDGAVSRRGEEWVVSMTPREMVALRVQFDDAP